MKRKAFDSENYTEALKHIDWAEDQLDIVDEIIKFKLGSLFNPVK
jgi:hypothetical protein